MRWDASNEDAWRDGSVIVLRPGGRDVGGGTTAHDMTCNNLRAALHAGLRGKPCRPQGPDLKVKAERNGRYPDALGSWRKRATVELSTVDNDQIANLLLEASRRAELLADNSKEVFEPVHRAAPDSLDELRILLDRALV